MEIARYLEQARVGRVGESIFIGEMPTECEQGILLIDSYSGTSIDHELPGWRDTGFRVVTRSPQYEAGMALAEKVSGVLTIRRETPMGGRVLMRQCLPQNDPLPYRRSRGSGIWEFEVDVECIYIRQPVP